VTAARAEPIVELREWADVRFVLRSRSFEQVAPEDGYSEGTELQGKIIGDSLVMARGDGHFERRRLESALFRLPTLVEYEREIVRRRLDATLARLAESRDADGCARGDVVEIGEDVLLAVMAKMIGIDVSTPEREARFGELFSRLDRGTRVRHMVDMHAALREGLEVQRLFEEEFFRPAWAEHAGRLAAGEELPNDLVSLMLRNQEHFSQWDDGIYLREATLFVSASIGTTIREIALCVDALERWLDDHPEDAAKRTDPEFLSAAFAESCRVHQSIQDVGRTAIEDITLPSGLRIQAGQPVRLSLVGANRDLVGGDADSFDPHRSAPSEGDRTGLAFSDGRHTCIGKILVLGGGPEDGGRMGTALTVLLQLYGAGMRRDPTREPVLKETTTRRFDVYPVVFEEL
jgi:cytochrome P450